jgi:peptidoglycan/xylan/chitin deacetylase (PgdA/CDA1 family)
MKLSIKTSLLTAVLFAFSSIICRGQTSDANMAKEKTAFQWPKGKKVAVSLTFDDSKLSQTDEGIPLLDKYNIKGTFYVRPITMMQRLDAWKKAVKNGHDIGNHSVIHPCTGNWDWSRSKALEDYTLTKMGEELDSANKVLKENLGITPVSFAFPCGLSFVGRGKDLKSYIPLVASMFETGRLYMGEGPNDPAFCDMAQLIGIKLDGLSFEEVKVWIDEAKSTGKWLILVGHEMRVNDNQTSPPATLSPLEAVCKYAMDPANEIWIDNVHNIATYIKAQRGFK